MTGLYSPINRLMEQVTRPKGTGAEYMTELQKKPGYKPAEAEDRNLQALMALPQMERAAFMEKLKGQANKFPLKQRELTGSQTHHEKYTLPGGENYREILLHTPMPEGKGFPGVKYHFGGTPNILASVMAKDRISPEGKKILHLEEIQSDWHQQGRKKGYINKEELKAAEKHLRQSAKRRKEAVKAINDISGRTPDDLWEQYDRLNDQAQQAKKQLAAIKAAGVPYGPHAKDWHELALKAMIQYAAENGYDQIAINHGKTVADRYRLSKAVKHIDATRYSLPEIGPVADINVAGLNGAQLHAKHGATEKELVELLGEELAKKIISQPEESTHRHEGEGLDIGGQGMKGFYDRMVPTFLNKFGKKHGVQVQQGGIQTDEDEMVPDNAGLGMIRSGNKRVAPVHTFDITPAMREDVLKNGIPRYADGGDVGMAEGGSVSSGLGYEGPSIDQMREEVRNFSPFTNARQTLQGALENIKAVPGNIQRLVQDPVGYVKSMPAPTKDQLLNALGPGNIGMAGVMIGPNAKTWNAANATKAEAMERAGQPPEKIWQETGNYRAPDKEWRQEINDQPATFQFRGDLIQKAKDAQDKIAALKGTVKGSLARDKEVVSDMFPKEAVAARKAIKGQVSELESELNQPYGVKSDPEYSGNYLKYAYEHPELYAAYPDLQTVILKQGQQGSPGTLGSYGKGDLNVYRYGLARDPKSTTAHEIQHAIQEIEKTPRGGEPGEFWAIKQMANNRIKLHNEILSDIAEQIKNTTDPAQLTRLMEKYYTHLADRDKLVPYLQMDPYQEYLRLAGEAEARMVQNRLNMSPEERANTFPLNSYDVDATRLNMIPQGESVIPNLATGGVVKEKVTISPNMDVMQYELINRKAK
jgi:hypothetical protein